MSELGFGTSPTFISDGGLVVSISPDGQVFTATFSDAEVAVATGDPASIATRVVSMVVPVEGSDEGGEIAVSVSGFAFVTEGATGLATITINGRASTEYLSPGVEDDFVYELRVDLTGSSECRISVFLVAERDSANPDAVARFNVLSIDANLSRQSA
jgi:hypothetical protein